MITYWTNEGAHTQDNITKSIIPDVAPAGGEHNPAWALAEYAPPWATHALAVGDWWPLSLRGFWHKVGNMWLLDFTHITLDVDLGCVTVTCEDGEIITHHPQEPHFGMFKEPKPLGSTRYWLQLEGETTQVSAWEFANLVAETFADA